MNGTPESISTTLIEDLNLLKSRSAGDISLDIARIKRDAKKLQKDDAVSSFIIQGGIASLEGDVENMISFHKKALRHNDTNYVALYNFATSLSFCFMYSDAIEIYNRLLEIGDNKLISLSQLSKTYSILGDYSTAHIYSSRYLSEKNSDLDQVIKEIAKMDSQLAERRIPNSDVEKYAAVMNDILKKNNFRLRSIETWVTEDNELIRDVHVTASPEYINKLNDDLIEALDSVELTKETMLNFSGYFVSTPDVSEK